jgi:hypothetical protein
MCTGGITVIFGEFETRRLSVLASKQQKDAVISRSLSLSANRQISRPSLSARPIASLYLYRDMVDEVLADEQYASGTGPLVDSTTAARQLGSVRDRCRLKLPGATRKCGREVTATLFAICAGADS